MCVTLGIIRSLLALKLAGGSRESTVLQATKTTVDAPWSNQSVQFEPHWTYVGQKLSHSVFCCKMLMSFADLNLRSTFEFLVVGLGFWTSRLIKVQVVLFRPWECLEYLAYSWFMEALFHLGFRVACGIQTVRTLSSHLSHLGIIYIGSDCVAI